MARGTRSCQVMPREGRRPREHPGKGPGGAMGRGEGEEDGLGMRGRWVDGGLFQDGWSVNGVNSIHGRNLSYR
jgi:hypothetical protein